MSSTTTYKVGILSHFTTKWTWLAAAAVGISSLIYLGQKKMRIQRHESIPMLDDFNPYIGHLKFFVNNISTIHDAISKRLLLASKTTSMSSTYCNGWYHVWTLNPAIIKYIFTEEFDSFEKGEKNTKRSGFEDVLGKYGQGIFVSDGKEWRFHRKIASRMFSVRNVRDYMYECCIFTTNSTLEILSKYQNKAIDINDILGRMTFDCFTNIAFGSSFNSMKLYPNPHPFGRAFDDLLALVARRSSDPFWTIKKYLNIGYNHEINQCLKVMEDFTNKAVENRSNIASLTDESGKAKYDMLSLYLAHNPNISKERLKYIALNLIIAGRDTTRLLLSWFLYDMSLYPKIKQKVCDEISKFETINYSLASRGLQYLEAVLCESLRSHPVVPFSVRVAKKDIKLPKRVCPEEYIIKKNDKIKIHNYSIGKYDKIYPNPQIFDPMRFYKKGVRTFDSSAFPFFNHSPRLCLGRDFALMEAKIFVFHFFKKYDFKLIPNQEITYRPGAVLNMKNGLKILLIRKE